MKPSRCVFTVVVGGFEELLDQPCAQGSEVDFICFTDSYEAESATWQTRLFKPRFPSDNARSSRWPKINPHLFLPEHEESLYIDASVRLRQKPEVIFEDLLPPGVGLTAMAHAYRDSVRVRTGTILMQFRFDPRYTIDQEIACKGRLSSPRRPGNFGDFDYARFLARKNVHAVFSPEGSPTSRHPEPRSAWGWTASVIIPVRTWINARLHRHLSGEPEGLVRGILFGEKSVMSERTVRAFERTGTLHLLAVSGSNVAVVIGVLFGAATFFRLPAPSRIGICLFGVVLFSYLAHNEASVIRASVAGALVLCGRLLKRPTDAFNILGATLLILLCYEPRQLYDIGFQLSFAATMGILVFAQSRGGGRVSKGLWNLCARTLGIALGVSTAAQLAVIPILAGAFNSVPLVTPISNLICVPLAGLTTAAGLVTLLIAPLGGWPLSVMSASTWLFAQLLLGAVEWFHDLNFPVWQLSTPGPFECLVYYSGLILSVLFWRVRRLRRVLLLGVLILLNAWMVFSALKPNADLKVVVVSAGPQFLSLVQWPGGEVWQIGTGESVRDRRTSEIVKANLVRLGWSDPSVTWLLCTALSDGSIQAGAEHSSDDITGPLPPGSIQARAASQARFSVHVWAGNNPEVYAIRIRSQTTSISWIGESQMDPMMVTDGDRQSVVIVLRIDQLPIAFDTASGVTCWIEGSSSHRKPSASPIKSGVQVLRTRDDGAIAISLSPAGVSLEPSFR